MILEDILKVLKNSDEVAYTENGKTHTYKELYKYVCNIYAYLKEKNIGKKAVIVYGKKEVYMKAAFLACSFAGMTYIPVDESLPESRLDLIINQVNPEIIIGKTISKEEMKTIMENEDFSDISIEMKKEDVYYNIFTSGTTGDPKGINVTYGNLDTCVKWLKEILPIEKGVIINQANFSFDLSVADLYLSLVTNSNHYILNENKMDFSKIYEDIRKSEGEIMVATPSFIDLLLLDRSFSEDLMPKLRYILFCGEKLNKKTVDKLYSRFKNLKIINSYGPSEATFAVTWTLIERDKEYEEIPIGVPKKGVDIYIVDEKLNKLSENEKGEILIVGDSVAARIYRTVKKADLLNMKGRKAI